MASTNKTTHYELSQYVGSDKPTYLTDYNGDMLAIDTGIYNAQTKADTAFANAGTADTKADNATLTANQALNSAGSANTNIGTMANLNTTEKTTLVGAINEVNNRLNFVSFKRFTENDYSVTNNAFWGGNNLNIAKTADGAYCKIYGQINFAVSTTQSADSIFTITNTGLSVDSEFTVIGVGLEIIGDSSIRSIFRSDVKFKTNGDLELNLTTLEAGKNYTIILHPSVIQVKSFGDQPE